MTSKEEWVEWLKLKGLSDKSIGHYNLYFDKLDLNNLNSENLFALLKRFNNGVARAMVKNLLYFIKTSPDFPKEMKGLAQTFEVPKQTGRKRIRVLKILTKEQIHQLAKGMEHKRDRYMVLLTFYLGLRVSELLNLKLDCFNWKDGKVRIIGKGDKERILPLIPELQERITEYINDNLEKDSDFDLLFPISEKRWQVILDKNSQRILGRRLNPHLLRHSCGSYLHNQGVGLKEIAEFLGHSSIQTVQIYVHLDKKKLDSQILGAFK